MWSRDKALPHLERRDLKTMMVNSLLVVDIGKTNLKLTVLAADGSVGFQRTQPNYLYTDGTYPSYDVEAIWDWLVTTIGDAAVDHPTSHICVAAHGAAAALIHPDKDEGENGLVLPVLDYEWDGCREFDEEYEQLRPEFSESLSPALPAGLNLGRQFYWQSRRFPEEFQSAKYILPYAQYWSWRLCGVAACEVSALGSHTDLWAPKENTFSSLVGRLDWREKFAPVRPAWMVLGNVLPPVAEATGLASDCQVLTGVHDSNASHARFMGLARDARPVVVSTGTWVVAMHSSGDLSQLDPHRDMLANVDVTGAPIACARYMGGREFAEICTRLGCEASGECSVHDLQSIIDDKVFALPDFSGGSGPFGGRRAEIVENPSSGLALANLYAALMIDLELDLLGASGPVVIDGSFSQNETLCALLASLRPRCRITRMSGSDGVAQGCLLLAHWNTDQYCMRETSKCEQIKLEGLSAYRNEWRRRCKQDSEDHNA
jgi:sugar (pentulose or hexulose) kinase